MKRGLPAFPYWVILLVAKHYCMLKFIKKRQSKHLIMATTLVISNTRSLELNIFSLNLFKIALNSIFKQFYIQHEH